MPPPRSVIDRARRLRANQTDAERLLWGRLRARRLAELKFRRQEPVGPFVTDFCCVERRLIVELDGDQHGHDQARRRDELRTALLEREGFRVIRFWNHEVMQDLDSICETILAAADGRW